MHKVSKPPKMPLPTKKNAETTHNYRKIEGLHLKLLMEMLVYHSKTNISRGEASLVYVSDGVLFSFEIFTKNLIKRTRYIRSIPGLTVVLKKQSPYKGCGRRDAEKMPAMMLVSYTTKRLNKKLFGKGISLLF